MKLKDFVSTANVRWTTGKEFKKRTAQAVHVRSRIQRRQRPNLLRRHVAAGSLNLLLASEH